ncbi:MAG TPA: hypothetical protein VNL71_04130 [Chloroflexota bacterium]|nr:hypothetical protein [Chloroflexota bacterium]
MFKIVYATNIYHAAGEAADEYPALSTFTLAARMSGHPTQVHHQFTGAKHRPGDDLPWVASGAEGAACVAAAGDLLVPTAGPPAMVPPTSAWRVTDTGLIPGLLLGPAFLHLVTEHGLEEAWRLRENEQRHARLTPTLTDTIGGAENESLYFFPLPGAAGQPSQSPAC